MLQRSPKHTLAAARIGTPTGDMLCVWGADGRVRALEWADKDDRFHTLLARYQGPDTALEMQEAAPATVSRALAAYFEGDFAATAAIEAGLANALARSSTSPEVLSDRKIAPWLRKIASVTRPPSRANGLSRLKKPPV